MIRDNYVIKCKCRQPECRWNLSETTLYADCVPLCSLKLLDHFLAYFVGRGPIKKDGKNWKRLSIAGILRPWRGETHPFEVDVSIRDMSENLIANSSITAGGTAFARSGVQQGRISNSKNTAFMYKLVAFLVFLVRVPWKTIVTHVWVVLISYCCLIPFFNHYYLKLENFVQAKIRSNLWVIYRERSVRSTKQEMRIINSFHSFRVWNILEHFHKWLQWRVGVVLFFRHRNPPY